MRLSPKSLDIDAFRSFLEAAGAEFTAPNSGAGEVLRFRIGVARGAIAQRADGRLTFVAVARPMFLKFQSIERDRRLTAASPQKEATC